MGFNESNDIEDKVDILRAVKVLVTTTDISIGSDFRSIYDFVTTTINVC